jgi:hypothetical protein
MSSFGFERRVDVANEVAPLAPRNPETSSRPTALRNTFDSLAYRYIIEASSDYARCRGDLHHSGNGSEWRETHRTGDYTSMVGRERYR